MMPNGYERLKARISAYDPGYDREKLDKAFDIAFAGHMGQIRKSGDPYIIHPVEGVIAGLLHDTIEDTRMTYDEIAVQMGKEIADLVEGVTKLSMLSFSTKEERQAENLRKMLMAMAKDIRVILHNMRTLKYMSEEKQKEKAQETLEIYAPLAGRLGISKIKWELEDLSLRYIDPKGYYELVEKISIKRREREEYIGRIKNDLIKKAEEMDVKINVDGRPKHFYSIYRKMKEQNRTLDQIYDLIAVRVIVDTIKNCYSILGMVHDPWKVQGLYRDA